MEHLTAKRTKSEKFDEKLARYPLLPDDALVSIAIVCALYERSRASIWRDVKAGRCPAPVRIGTSCTRWRVGDLRKATQNAAR